MKSEKSHPESNRPSSEKSHFSGSVEIIPPRPMCIEFFAADRLIGIPLNQLDYFSLGNNPFRDGKRTSPADLLLLVFQTRLVCLLGWRLELMVDALMQGRVKRIHAEKYLGTLIIGEPWVSEIKVIPRYETIPL